MEYGVYFIVLDLELFGNDFIVMLNFFFVDFVIDVVIGYGRKLGLLVNVVVKLRRCKWVYIVYMVSE